MLAGAVVAELALGDGRVVFSGALASVADRLANESAGLADERLRTATLELTNTGGRQGRRAGLEAFSIHEVPAIAADAAGVTGGDTVAEVTVGVVAPAVRAGLGPSLDPPALAGYGRVAPSRLDHPVVVARRATALQITGMRCSESASRTSK